MLIFAGGRTMHVAQSGIFALGTGSHSYLEFDLLESADPVALVQAIATLREPRTTTGGVNLVVGIRPSLWRRVAPQEIPAGVTDFDEDVRGRWLSRRRRERGAGAEVAALCRCLRGTSHRGAGEGHRAHQRDEHRAGRRGPRPGLARLAHGDRRKRGRTTYLPPQ